MKKQTYDLEETLHPAVSKRLKKTEIAVECSVLDIRFSFDVGRSMFDVGRSSFFMSCFVLS
jgi:hypothetical protein